MMRVWARSTLGVVFLLNIACATPKPQPVYVAPNAPKDRLVEATAETRDELHASLEPYIEQARATYPGARDRYLAGLPPQHSFFVVTRLRDAEGKTEQVFIAVAQIRDGKVTGRIWNDIHLVRGFEQGQTYTLPESDLIDWVISRPDGSEEGNFVGKFLDEYQSKH